MMVFLNGRLVPDKEALVSVEDHGFLYGDGVYETVRVYAGKPFLLHDHLRRLNDSLRGIRLTPSLSLIEIGKAIQKTIAANRVVEGVARVTITRGPGPRGFDMTGLRRPTTVVTAGGFKGHPAEHYKKGIKAAVVSVRRTDPRALPPDLKINNCLNQILARMEAAELGAQEAIMLSSSNQIAEGAGSNVFIVKGGAVLTPRLDGNLLPGVTREYVIRLARDAGYMVEEKKLPLSALATADEVFLTNSTFEIMPVSRLVFNAKPGGEARNMRLGPYTRSSGFVGPVTLDLMNRFRLTVRSYERVNRPDRRKGR